MNAPLTPVDFRKGRAHEPRLSVPYVPGKHHERYWTAEEEATVRQYYPEGGVNACQTHLPPQRSRSAIHAFAHKLGVKSAKMPPRKEPRPKFALDETIKERWPLLKGRGAVAKLSEELDIPRWQLSQTAARLGLTIPHKKEPPWTAVEEALLRKVPLHSPRHCSRIFAEHGYQRTPTAIIIHSKRLRLSRRATKALEGFSGTAAARLLGVDNKTTTQWCIAGELKASRRQDKRLPQQGGASWLIKREDLRQFVLDNLGRIDFRKVDKFALVDLLVNRPLARNPYEMG